MAPNARAAAASQPRMQLPWQNPAALLQNVPAGQVALLVQAPNSSQTCPPSWHREVPSVVVTQ